MYYTVKEVAEKLRLSEKTIRNKIDQKELSVVRVSDRSIRIKESAIETYIQKKNTGKD